MKSAFSLHFFKVSSFVPQGAKDLIARLAILSGFFFGNSQREAFKASPMPASQIWFSIIKINFFVFEKESNHFLLMLFKYSIFTI